MKIKKNSAKSIHRTEHIYKKGDQVEFLFLKEKKQGIIIDLTFTEEKYAVYTVQDLKGTKYPRTGVNGSSSYCNIIYNTDSHIIV